MKTLKILTAAVIFTSLSVALYGQAPTGDQGNFDASATVMNPLVIENVSNLNFGTIFNGLTATMDPVAENHSNIGLLEADNEAVLSVIDITGSAAAEFNISINNNTENVTLSNGDDDITLSLLAAFSSDETTYGSVNLNGTATLGAGGEGWLRIGGTIDLATEAAEGTYTATEIPVVIDYNSI